MILDGIDLELGVGLLGKGSNFRYGLVVWEDGHREKDRFVGLLG